MRLKPGVSLKGLTPQMALAAVIVRDVYFQKDPACSCTITSANDGKHGEGSLHSKDGLCRALDFRTHDYRGGDVDKLAYEIQQALGDEFDVVVEDLNGPNEHIHVEHQPE